MGMAALMGVDSVRKVVVYHMLQLQRMHAAPDQQAKPPPQNADVRHRRQSYVRRAGAVKPKCTKRAMPFNTERAPRPQHFSQNSRLSL